MIKLGHIDGGFRKCVGDKIEVLVTGLVIESVTPSISDWLYVIYHHDKFCHPYDMGHIQKLTPTLIYQHQDVTNILIANLTSFDL